MARTIYNKHYNNSQEVNTDRFANGTLGLGEIVLCNEPGNEGLYLINKLRQLVKIAPFSGAADSVVVEEVINRIEGWINDNFAQIDWVNDTFVKNEDMSDFATSGWVNDNFAKIEDLYGLATSRWVNDNFAKIDDLGNLATKDDIFELSERIDNIPSGSSIIDEDAVRDIVDDELSKQISSSLTSDVEYLMSLSADTRLDSLEDKIDGVVKLSDHIVLTYQQYQELTTSGTTYVEGYGQITYDKDFFYCIYEDAEPAPTPTPSSGGGINISGTTVEVSEQEETDLDNHIITIGYLSYDPNTGLLELDVEGGDGEGDSGGEVSGDTASPNDGEYVEPGQQDATPPYVEMEINDITDGIVDTDWVIEEK